MASIGAGAWLAPEIIEILARFGRIVSIRHVVCLRMDTGRGYTRGFLPAGMGGYGYGSRFQTRAQPADPTRVPVDIIYAGNFAGIPDGFGDPRVNRGPAGNPYGF
ncbi:hypothetical protein DFH08DRAFT_803922 [Mycena albidolilacea]|uniref:Uncharacterized protein n=1 Tax=Mycena albidolilacea TaxID=1033008 RepID=A0AAD7EVT4_9AGAR|nr:hypothetical protein DFH08DRAFT_803922 [Mycena albidolilacea]